MQDAPLYSKAKQRLTALVGDHGNTILKGGLTGIEKESLRVGADGSIAQTPHPAVLGSALTHPSITTDYSEALLEFITPPLESAGAALDYLQELQHFVYMKLDGELLWSSSMPCVVAGGESIPIARYADTGTRRTVIAVGLAVWSLMTAVSAIAQSFSQRAASSGGSEASWSGPSGRACGRNHKPLR